MNTAAIVPIVPPIELKRILYATDFSEAARSALPVVAVIARHYGSRVYVAHVACAPIYPMVSPDVVSVMDSKQRRQARQILEGLLHTPALAGISAEAVVRQGIPAEQLERLVRENNIGLAVASTHGRTGFKHHVLGSVAEELVRGLSCPVLTVGPHLAPRFDELKGIANILFPTEFSLESLAVFPYVASLAHEYQSPLTILHVLPAEAAKDPEFNKLTDGLRKQMEKCLGPQISPRCSADFAIDVGDPAETILAHARRTKAELIGMGVRGAKDISHQFRRTVAYRILAGAECPVLTHHAVSRW
jgi:nucleotide-binding universal stress UspA family protein